MSRERPNRTPELVRPLFRRFSDVLPGPALAIYNRIPQEMQLDLENGLNRVPRMGGVIRQNFPVPPHFHESDHDHVFEFIVINNEFFQNYPELRPFVDFDTEVPLMGPIHDVGEINPAIKDVPTIDRTPEEERRKLLEPFAGRLILARIPDLDLRADALGLYNRFLADEPWDLNVQMAHLIDKIQGTTRNADVMFDTARVSDELTVEQIKKHLSRTIDKFLVPALNLMEWLESREARGAVRRIVSGEMGFIINSGNADVAEEKLKIFEQRAA